MQIQNYYFFLVTKQKKQILYSNIQNHNTKSHQIMDSELSCPLCNQQYSQQCIPRLLTMCGHSFCQNCIQTIIAETPTKKYKVVCPEDGQSVQINDNNVNLFPKNLALLKLIQANQSKSSFKDSSFDVSKIVKLDQIQEDDDAKDLITAIKQSRNESGYQQNNQEFIQPQTDNQENQVEEEQDEQNLCLLHQKPLQVVCIVDLQRICAKCAIFGQHKGHQFKSVQQIQAQNDQFYKQVLKIFEDKEAITQRFKNQQTKQELISILNNKKELMQREIKQKFKKLSQAIKAQQKKCLNDLQKIAVKTEKQIEQLLKINPKVIQKYKVWEQISFQKIQIIEGGTFQQKLQLIFVDQNKQPNIIDQGNKIIDQIRIQEEDLINKVEILLNNITIKYQQKIMKDLSTFAQVIDQSTILKNPITKESPIRQLQKSKNAFQHAEDDLLEIDPTQKYQEQLQKNNKSQNNFINKQEISPIQKKRMRLQNNQQKQQIKQQIKQQTKQQIKQQIQSQQNSYSQSLKGKQSSRDNSFIGEKQKTERPNKKKLKSIKVPQKYEKIIEGLYNDNTQILDLTNAQLGQATILQICQFIPGTKIKTVKFIRNKLTDNCLKKMLPYLCNVITLNLSQNLFTQRAIDIFIDNRKQLQQIKNLILSLNKIVQRKDKVKIDKLRKLDLTVSV